MRRFIITHDGITISFPAKEGFYQSWAEAMMKIDMRVTEMLEGDEVKSSNKDIDEQFNKTLIYKYYEDH